MFPNSINGVIELLNVESKLSEIGVNEIAVISRRVCPCSIKSITWLEYLSSIEISKKHRDKSSHTSIPLSWREVLCDKRHYL